MKLFCAGMLAALLALICGCSREYQAENIQLSSESTQLPDATAFTSIFGDSITTVHDGASVILTVHRLQDLWFPSGQVTASDGFNMHAEPFARTVTPGRYELLLALADLVDSGERVALAMLRFSTAPVAKWELAVTEDQDVNKLKDGQAFGYGVDSGTGCFVDPSAQEIISNQLADKQGRKMFEHIIGEMNKNYKSTRQWVQIETSKGSAALFSSGFGDGFYSSYFGLDDAGTPVVLMTDFEIVNWPARPK